MGDACMWIPLLMITKLARLSTQRSSNNTSEE
jgi:hypothetical protein